MECAARGITPTYVAGFRAFLALNRVVRRGERAIRILAPVTVKERDASSEQTEAKRVFFKAVSVWDTLSRVRWWRTECGCRPLRGENGRSLLVLSRHGARASSGRVVVGLCAPLRSGSGRWLVAGVLVELLSALRSVVDERGGEVAVGVFLGELA